LARLHLDLFRQFYHEEGTPYEEVHLTSSAAVLVLGALALPASAQNEQRGAARISALLTYCQTSGV
jgi:hypothetical protein